MITFFNFFRVTLYVLCTCRCCSVRTGVPWVPNIGSVCANGTSTFWNCYHTYVKHQFVTKALQIMKNWYPLPLCLCLRPPGCRILFNTPMQLRKQKYAMEPAHLLLSLKLQSEQHAQMIPYNCWVRRENSLCELQLQVKKQLFCQQPAFIYMYKKSLRLY